MTKDNNEFHTSSSYRYTEKQLDARSKRTRKPHYSDPKFKLTDQQFDDLKCYYASDYVDTLSIDKLKDIVYGNLLDVMNDYTLIDVKNECEDCMKKGYFDELIYQVTNTADPPIEDPW